MDSDGGISLQVALLSGESVQLQICRDETVNELRLQTQQQLGVKVSNLVATDGRLLKGCTHLGRCRASKW